MAHLTVNSGYKALVERLNRAPQGAPPSKVLYKILKILFSEKEAELVAVLPIIPFTVEKAAARWKTDQKSAQKVLDGLASRAILLDAELQGKTWYALPPPMAGFFEFSMVRVNENVDQKTLAELYYQYLNVEEDFVRELFTGGETQLGRVFVNETTLSKETVAVVLDYERASAIIETSPQIGIGLCYCRHKMQHVGRDCNAPKDICIFLNETAASLIRHGLVRQVDIREGLDLLQLAREQNLVQFGDNVRERVNFICNCCGCCCEAMLAARRFAIEHPIHTTNFVAGNEQENCAGCGKCVEVCPIEAVALVSANDPDQAKRKKAVVDEAICLGCGVCARVCPSKAMVLKPRKERVITPLAWGHRMILMAIERGKLQDMIFDNRLMWSHRALATVLGVILRLPPAKQLMASKQIKSRYLEATILKIRSRQETKLLNPPRGNVQKH
jgi:ferredoxin